MAVPGQLRGKISGACDPSILTGPPHRYLPNGLFSGGLNKTRIRNQRDKAPCFLQCQPRVTSGTFATSPTKAKVCPWLPEPRRNFFACSVIRPKTSVSAKSTAAPAKAKLTSGSVRTDCFIARLAAKLATTQPRASSDHHGLAIRAKHLPHRV